MQYRPRRPLHRPRGRTYRDLRTYIRQTGDTQAAIARAVDASQAQISRIVSGVAVPRADLAYRLERYASLEPGSFNRRSRRTAGTVRVA